jgi:hypothetical protein
MTTLYYFLHIWFYNHGIMYAMQIWRTYSHSTIMCEVVRWTVNQFSRLL